MKNILLCFLLSSISVLSQPWRPGYVGPIGGGGGGGGSLSVTGSWYFPESHFTVTQGTNVFLEMDMPVLNAANLTNYQQYASTNKPGVINSNLFVFIDSAKNVTASYRTPYRGYFTWASQYGPSSNQVRFTMDNYDKQGLREAGFNLIQMDDGFWYPNRDANGNLVCSNRVKDQILGTSLYDIPGGDLTALGNYVHSRGYKFGLYCQWPQGNVSGYNPTHRGYEYQDGLYLATLPIDFIKYDILPDGTTQDEKFASFKYVISQFVKGLREKATNAIVVKVSLGAITNQSKYRSWMSEVINQPCMGDVVGFAQEKYGDSTNPTNRYMAMLDFHDMIYSFRGVTGPGFYADPDAVQPSMWYSTSPTGSKTNWNKTDIGLKAILAAPIINYNDLDVTTYPGLAPFVAHMTNRMMLSIHDDPAGIMGEIVSSNRSGAGRMVTYVRPLGSPRGLNGWAVAFNNRDMTNSQSMSIQFTNLPGVTTNTLKVWDVWSQTYLGLYTNSYTKTVEAADTPLIKFEMPLIADTVTTYPTVTTLVPTNWIKAYVGYEIDFYAGTSSSWSRELNPNNTPNNWVNCIAAGTGTPGGACAYAYVPPWATQTVATVYYSVNKTTMRWTNQIRSISYPAGGGAVEDAGDSLTDLPFTISGNWGSQTVTRDFDSAAANASTNVMKCIQIFDAYAPTNTIYIERIVLDNRGYFSTTSTNL